MKRNAFINPPAPAASRPLPGFAFFPGWLGRDKADALFQRLKTEVPWERHTVTLFGRTMPQPRLTYWFGEKAYAYSGAAHAPAPMPDYLEPLRDRAEKTARCPFNSLLAILYRDGGDSVGWHADNEASLGSEPTIFSVSFGDARGFRIKHRRYAEQSAAFSLGHGDGLLMTGRAQVDWLHAAPKTTRRVGPRISLTFRHVY